ncbi:MAG: hypothetical protein DCC71_16890 [Proteobacteria bacterium]|nr:MAG: hypothetical protein DCC71_16890 [Pseudomonadota bacterium]
MRMSASAGRVEDARGRRAAGAIGRCVPRLLIAALLVTVALAGAAAQAAPLAFTGSLSIQIGPYGLGIAGDGVAEVDGQGHLTSLALPAGAFRASGLVVSVTETAAYPVAGLQFTGSNAAGTFANPGGGALALLGAAKVCLFGPCSAAVANLTVPLDVVGQGGTTSVAGAVDVTVQGAAWTVGTAQIGTATAMGFAFGPDGQTSSTARASGRIQLVTPIRILTNLPGDLAVVPAFGILTLHFVPEPTTLLLLGAGLAAIAARARAR